MSYSAILNNGSIDTTGITTGITLPITNGGIISRNSSVSVFDEKVRGEMLAVQKVVGAHELEMIKLDEDTFNQQIKRELAFQLAEQILQNKFVEFTKQENYNTGQITYRARAYLTPDDKVRMLRKTSL
jgi:hypothetical protein